MRLYEWEVRGLRRRLDAGESLPPDEQARLVDALGEVMAASRLPSEFIVRVHKNPDATTWDAEHPLLQGHSSAVHPGDALALAGAELRRVLDATYPDLAPVPEPGRWGRNLDQIGWEALLTAPPSELTTAALAQVLDALSDIRRENADLLYGRDLLTSLESRPDNADLARAELRARHRERLTEVNVEGADVSWAEDAFGTGSQTMKVFIRPLTPTPAAELGLRRTAEDITDGDSVADHVALFQAVDRHLPGVSVERVRGGWRRSGFPSTGPASSRSPVARPMRTGPTTVSWSGSPPDRCSRAAARGRESGNRARRFRGIVRAFTRRLSQEEVRRCGGECAPGSEGRQSSI